MRPHLVIVAAVVMLAGCEDSTGPDSLRYRATTSIESAKPVVLQTVVIVRNEGTRMRTIRRNACPSALELHLTADRNEDPVWSSWIDGTECAAIAAPLDLAPGDYYEFRFSIPVAATVPDGLYYLTMVGVSRISAGVAAGQIVITNGTAHPI